MTNPTLPLKGSDMQMSNAQKNAHAQLSTLTPSKPFTWSQDPDSLNVTGILTLPYSTLTHPMRVYVSLNASGSCIMELHTGRQNTPEFRVQDITPEELSALAK